eukprot:g17407.t1
MPAAVFPRASRFGALPLALGALALLTPYHIAISPVQPAAVWISRVTVAPLHKPLMESVASLCACALKSVATVACCAACGVYARRQGILDETSEKFLDKTPGNDRFVSSVCMPCLILRKVPPLITLKELVAIWPLTLGCLCTVVCGLLAGALAAWALKIRSFSGLMMTAVAFPNSFSVPLTLLLAIDPTRLGQAEGADLEARISMLFLASYPFWVVARWGIGFPVLSGAWSFEQWQQKVLNPPVKASEPNLCGKRGGKAGKVAKHASFVCVCHSGAFL